MYQSDGQSTWLYQFDQQSTHEHGCKQYQSRPSIALVFALLESLAHFRSITLSGLVIAPCSRQLWTADMQALPPVVQPRSIRIAIINLLKALIGFPISRFDALAAFDDRLHYRSASHTMHATTASHGTICEHISAPPTST